MSTSIYPSNLKSVSVTQETATADVEVQRKQANKCQGEIREKCQAESLMVLCILRII